MFTGERGYEEYKAEVKINIHWGINETTKRTFKIVSMNNKNNDSSLRVSI